MSIEGLIDFHVHAGPDVRPRKATYLETAAAARASGMHGLMFKSHVTCTADIAGLVSSATPGLAAFGGLALNDEVGGFNLHAVAAALKLGARHIWMPTFAARHHRIRTGNEAKGLSILDSEGSVKAEVKEILAMIRDAGAILGSGHLSPEEIFALAREAVGMGVKKILITHADFYLTDLSLPEQRELARWPVFFERCYLAAGRGVSWDELAHRMREVGVDRSVLATDLGQPDNPSPVEGMRELVEELMRRGFSTAEIEIMGRRNPFCLLE